MSFGYISRGKNEEKQITSSRIWLSFSPYGSIFFPFISFFADLCQGSGLIFVKILLYFYVHIIFLLFYSLVMLVKLIEGPE